MRKMRVVAVVCGCAVIAGATVCQTNAVKIALKPTSTTPPAYLMKNLPDKGCSNVTIVTDVAQADYLLEARGGDFEGPSGSEGPHPPRAPRPKASYTLYKGETVVFGTTPVKEQNAVKDLCKFLMKGAGK
jgi:hypothetical protein